MAGERKRLTKAQRAVLERMAAGNTISYSQDGESGWLWPSKENLDEFGISNAELQSLRRLRLIAPEYEDDPESRFSPPEVITPAGRRALAKDGGGND